MYVEDCKSSALLAVTHHSGSLLTVCSCEEGVGSIVLVWLDSVRWVIEWISISWCLDDD